MDPNSIRGQTKITSSIESDGTGRKKIKETYEAECACLCQRTDLALWKCEKCQAGAWLTGLIQMICATTQRLR